MFARSHTIKDYPGQMAGLAAFSALIGAFAALLVTPRRGDEVRHGLKRRGILAKDTMKHKVAELRSSDKIDQAADKTKSAVDKTANRAKNDTST